MKNFLSVIFVLLVCTCWLYPVLFVENLLKCIEAIVQQKEPKEYRRNVLVSAVSLICISISPFVIALLITA